MPGASPERVLARYIALLDQLAEEENGNESAVARRLGVSQGSINKARAGQRGPGRKAISNAVELLEISPDYFYGDHAGTPHYRTFREGALAEERYPALAEFFGGAWGRGLSPDERAYLRRAAFKSADVQSYMELLTTYRRRSVGAPDVDPLEEARARALAKGGRPLKR